MDEKHRYCNKRFAQLGNSADRRDSRAIASCIVTTPRLGDFDRGVQSSTRTLSGRRRATVQPLSMSSWRRYHSRHQSGHSAKDLAGHPGENVTEGLDGLRDRLQEYSVMGARLAPVARCDYHGPAFPVGVA